ncbi:NADP-dependent oxidoreductase [Enemella sp. A6]|uniref:NADP-dependent oxidoreductase n=1 Tax=Enemella sp. A6 TaxID=3440152 RepID=UPI003EB876DE
MKQVAIFEYGGPEVLQVIEAPVPEPGPGEVLVEMIASGINPVDYKMRQGKSVWLEGFTDFPFVPGREGAGRITALGSGVSDFAVGDLVFGHPGMAPKEGCHAEYAVFAADRIAHAPEDVDPIILGGTPMAALTAWTAVHTYGRVQSGDRVLIHGAGGGVGQWVVQWCVLAGATVFGSASTRHRERLTELGAEHLDYTAGDVFAAMGEPADVVIDLVYFDTFEPSLDHVAEGGRIIAVPSLADLSPAEERGIEAHIAIMESDPEVLARVGRDLSAGRVSTKVAQVFAMEDLAEAHRILETGHAPGKLVLDLRR